MSANTHSHDPRDRPGTDARPGREEPPTNPLGSKTPLPPRGGRGRVLVDVGPSGVPRFGARQSPEGDRVGSDAADVERHDRLPLQRAYADREHRPRRRSVLVHGDGPGRAEQLGLRDDRRPILGWCSVEYFDQTVLFPPWSNTSGATITHCPAPIHTFLPASIRTRCLLASWVVSSRSPVASGHRR